MGQFKNILTEGLTDVLWHKTGITNVIRILKSDRFRLSTSLGTSADQYGTKAFFFSTARSPQSSYFRMSDSSAVLKLDGRKLGYNYKGFPVGYWSGMGSPADTDEMEDRIVHTKPFIPKATSYITEIRVMLPTNEMDMRIGAFDRMRTDTKGKSDTEIRKILGKPTELGYRAKDRNTGWIKELLTIAKKRGVTVRFFLSASDLKTGRKEVPSSVIWDSIMGHRREDKFGDDKYRSRGPRFELSRALMALHDLTPEQLLIAAKNRTKGRELWDIISRYLLRPMGLNDLNASWANEIHNDRSSGSPVLKRLADFFRKNGYRNVKEATKAISDRWIDIMDQMYQDGTRYEFVERIKGANQQAIQRAKERRS